MRNFLLALLLAASAKQGGQDQRLYKLVDRQNQIAGLLTAGKLAYDAGDFAVAVEKWEALLRIDHLPADVESAIKPMIALARSRSLTLEPLGDKPAKPEEPPKPVPVDVGGTIGGGGAVGPGGAVVTLRRLDGPTPRPAPVNRPMLEKDKRFAPHVLAVPVGSTVTFRNADDIFHNVFSLSATASFDTGLHKGGAETAMKFDKPGVIELLCNIHATMLGYLVVVDSPYYAVTDGSGAFRIKGVPPGEYEMSVWHESASALEKRKVTVAEGAQISLTVPTDKRPNPFPPDKYGKPRQQQLGY